MAAALGPEALQQQLGHVPEKDHSLRHHYDDLIPRTQDDAISQEKRDYSPWRSYTVDRQASYGKSSSSSHIQPTNIVKFCVS